MSEIKFLFDSDGEVNFVYDSDDGSYLGLLFRKDGSLSFYARTSEGKVDSDSVSFSDEVFEVIKELATKHSVNITI